MKFNNATLVLPRSRGSSQGTVFKNINVDVRNASFDRRITFSVSTHSARGKIGVRGEAGPVNHENPERTPFHATIKGVEADLAQMARLNSSTGLSGILGLDATADGRVLHGERTARVEKLRLTSGGSGSRQPVSFRYATDYSFARRTGSLNSCQIPSARAALV